MRTARRAATLHERLRNAPAPESGGSDVYHAMQRSVARSLQRSQEQVDRSRELCRLSAERLQQAAAVPRQSGRTRAAGPEVAERAQ